MHQDSELALHVCSKPANIKLVEVPHSASSRSTQRDCSLPCCRSDEGHCTALGCIYDVCGPHIQPCSRSDEGHCTASGRANEVCRPHTQQHTSALRHPASQAPASTCTHHLHNMASAVHRLQCGAILIYLLTLPGSCGLFHSSRCWRGGSDSLYAADPCVACARSCLTSLGCRPQWVTSMPRILRLLVKAVWQLCVLTWHMLATRPRPSLVLLQVPPAIPIMAVCWVTCWWHGAAWVNDWHNLGFTLMGLSMGQRHWLVSWVESSQGRRCCRPAQVFAHYTRCLQLYIISTLEIELPCRTSSACCCAARAGMLCSAGVVSSRSLQPCRPA